MFKNCLIDNIIVYCKSKGKSLQVCQRYLKKHYKIKSTLIALKRRFVYLKVKGKICEEKHTHDG